MLVVVSLAGLVGAGGVAQIRDATADEPTPATSWSVPYVDVTATPTFEFQNPAANAARDVVLSFVVASHDDPCTPSWGGWYSLDEASESIELDRRIAQLRAAGGDVVVSFGGQANDELSFVCDDDAALAAAYREVIERYDLGAIDLDIENADIADTESIERRARVIAELQAERAAADEPLDVWVTLPVATTGLTEDGAELVRATVRGGVELAGVNVMTMNFGSADAPTTDMLAATTSALSATAAQIGEIYRGEGVVLDETERWARLGATPMIGQNDVEGEVFTLDDAAGLAELAVTKGLGRISMWSLNRDQPCGPQFADVMVLSDVCSSVDQDPRQFTEALTKLPGPTDEDEAPTQATTILVPDHSAPVADDQASSPFPLWRPDADYAEGWKVVRHGMVYQAKWYNRGEEPSTTVGDAWDRPWSLVGPVVAEDPPFTLATVPDDTHPVWSPSVLYAKGDRVLLDDLPYQARWANQGEVPPMLFPVGTDSAWEPLFAVPGEPATT